MSDQMSNYSRVYERGGLFDASRSFGRVAARGKDAVDLLHRMSSNDLKPLEGAKSGSALTFLTNEKGRIIDLIKVVRESSGKLILITSAGKEETVVQWLDKFTIMEDARFESASENIAQFLLCGPDARRILSRYSELNESEETRTATFEMNFNSVPATLVKAPSLAGDGWFILTDSANAPAVWQELEKSVLAAGGALLDQNLYELLRIENGTPISPNELNEKHNPLETPVAEEAVSFTKGCYIGQEVIARLDAQQKVQRHLVGLKFESGLLAPGARIVDPEIAESAPLGNEIGEVTSTAQSPKFGWLGLGYVRGKYANPGTQLSVKSEDGNKLTAKLVTLPFHD